MTLAEDFLADADAGDFDGLVASEAAGHRPLEDMPRPIPVDADQGTCPLPGLAGLEDAEFEPSQQQCEGAVGLRPRHLHLNGTMLRALDARNTGVDDGLELTGVQVPPNALRGVVVAG